MQQNEMKLEFDSRSCNESLARVAAAAFMTQLNPTLEEVADVKTAVSEAVTNAIIHGYEGRIETVTLVCRTQGQQLLVEVRDYGKGIPDVALAMEPLYTTKAECDRAGMGFAFMEAFMDEVTVDSAPGRGTIVRMSKRIGRERGSEAAQIQREGAAASPSDQAQVFAGAGALSSNGGYAKWEPLSGDKDFKIRGLGSADMAGKRREE